MTGLSTTQAINSCCDFYQQDWVRLLTDGSFHPGGEALSRRTIGAMQLPPGARVADLGCGAGSSALLLAAAGDFRVSAFDLSEQNIAHATEQARQAGLAIDFRHADISDPPLEPGSMHGLLCECVFSLLADKPAALSHWHEALAPGGRLAITDMAVGADLAPDVAQAVAPWTCMLDALDQAGYEALFRQAGFELLACEDESRGIDSLILQIKRKLLLAGAGSLLGGGELPPIDLGQVRHWMQRVAEEKERGAVRYLRFHLQKPV